MGGAVRRSCVVALAFIGWRMSLVRAPQGQPGVHGWTHLRSSGPLAASSIDWIAEHLGGASSARPSAPTCSPATSGRWLPERSRRARAVDGGAPRPRRDHRARARRSGSTPASSPTSRRTPRTRRSSASCVAAGLGVQGMSWVTSPACTELETLVLDWMAELLASPRAFRSTSADRWQCDPGLGERGHARRHPVGAPPGDGCRQPRRRLRPGSSPTRPARPTRASRRDCGSPASAPIGVASCRTTASSGWTPASAGGDDGGRPGGRAGAVLRVRRRVGRRSSAGVRPDRRDRRRSACRGDVAARRRGDERGRRPRREHRWVNEGLGLRRQLLHRTPTSGWASTSTATCSGPPDRAPCSGALSILPEYLRCGGGRVRGGDRLPRLAGPARPRASGPSSCG